MSSDNGGSRDASPTADFSSGGVNKDRDIMNQHRNDHNTTKRVETTAPSSRNTTRGTTTHGHHKSPRGKESRKSKRKSRKHPQHLEQDDRQSILDEPCRETENKKNITEKTRASTEFQTARSTTARSSQHKTQREKKSPQEEESNSGKTTDEEDFRLEKDWSSSRQSISEALPSIVPPSRPRYQREEDTKLLAEKTRSKGPRWSDDGMPSLRLPERRSFVDKDELQKDPAFKMGFDRKEPAYSSNKKSNLWEPTSMIAPATRVSSSSEGGAGTTNAMDDIHYHNRRKKEKRKKRSKGGRSTNNQMNIDDGNQELEQYFETSSQAIPGATLGNNRREQDVEEGPQPGAVAVPGFDDPQRRRRREQPRLNGPEPNAPPDPLSDTVVANAVTTDDLEDRMRSEIRAEAVAAEVVQPKQPIWRSKRFVGCILVAFAAIGGIVGGVVYSLSNRDGPTTVGLTTAAPTPAPTPPLSPSDRAIVELLRNSSFDGGAALDNSVSPQSKSLRWLLHNDTNKEMYSTERILQRYALGTLFYSTNGNDWLVNSGWLTNEHECNWSSTLPSALCADGLFVSELGLEANNLVGALPPELALLFSTLDNLSLSGNNLTAMLIPVKNGTMNSLQRLHLSNNAITTIPSEIGMLSSLYELDLSKNEIAGTIPTELGMLTDIGIIHLDENSLWGRIPTELARMSKLEKLTMPHNQLSLSIPSEIGLITTLGELRLFRNNLAGPIPTEIGNLVNLEMLPLQKNHLSGTIPSEIGTMSSLKLVYFDNNKLSGRIPTEIGMLAKSLGWIAFYKNELRGKVPTEIGMLKRLHRANLHSNKFSGSLPTEMGLLTNLENFLYLNNNTFRGTVPTEIGMLTKLVALHIHDNNLTGKLPTEISLLNELTSLELYNNSFVPPFACPSQIEHCYVSCADQPAGFDSNCRELF